MKINPVDALLVAVIVLVAWWIIAFYCGFNQPPTHTPNWIKVETVMFVFPDIRPLIKENDIAIDQVPYAQILGIEEESSDDLKCMLLNQRESTTFWYLQTLRVTMQVDENALYFQGNKVKVGAWYTFGGKNYDTTFWVMRFL